MTLTPRLTPTTPPVPNRNRPSVSPSIKVRPNVWIPAGVRLADIPRVEPTRITSDDLVSPQCKRLHREPSSPHRVGSQCGLAVRVNEEDIALFRVDSFPERIYATQLTCPHMGARLIQGGRLLVDDIEDIVIECPLHRLRFDLNTGKLMSKGISDNLKVFPTRVRDDVLEIGFESMVLVAENF
jgi:nitrite reductase/ring-hydroxylating ferredoxin subunit